MTNGYLCIASLFATLLAIGPVSPAFAADAPPDNWKEARLIESDKPKEHVEGVVWKLERVEVESRSVGQLSHPVAKLEGEFRKEDWILVHGETQIELESDGKFSVSIPLQAEVTPVHLYAISPLGIVEDEKLVVVFKGWDAYQKKVRATLNPLKNAFFVGLGLTSMSYTQSRVQDFSENAITLRAAYQSIWIPPRWDYGFTAYLTLLPLTSNRSGVTARFFGLNARAGYSLPVVKEPWRVTLMGGIYYASMFVSGAKFGYSNVTGPMLYPVARRILSTTDSVSGYFKYSPITDGLAFLAVTNREVAAGLAWNHQRESGKQTSVSFDFADFYLLARNVSLRNKTFSLALSLGL